jgi:hypothetical protein
MTTRPQRRSNEGVILEETLCNVPLSQFMLPIRDWCADCLVAGGVLTFIIHELNAVSILGKV